MIKKATILTLLLVVGLMSPSIAQEAYDFDYKINTTHDGRVVNQQDIADAETIDDLITLYKPEWVKEYKSVDIVTIQDGNQVVVSGQDNRLSQVQKFAMQSIDANSEIKIVVNYLPNNNLKSNPVRNMDFSIHVAPDMEATFPGGESKLKSYLEKKAIKSVNGDIPQHQLAAVKFSVESDGSISNVSLHDPTTKTSVADVILNAIKEMPKWTPASYDNGLKVRQDFVLSVGDHKSCTLNLLNIADKHTD